MPDLVTVHSTNVDVLTAVVGAVTRLVPEVEVAYTATGIRLHTPDPEPAPGATTWAAGGVPVAPPADHPAAPARRAHLVPAPATTLADAGGLSSVRTAYVAPVDVYRPSSTQVCGAHHPDLEDVACDRAPHDPAVRHRCQDASEDGHTVSWFDGKPATTEHGTVAG